MKAHNHGRDRQTGGPLAVVLMMEPAARICVDAIQLYVPTVPHLTVMNVISGSGLIVLKNERFRRIPL